MDQFPEDFDYGAFGNDLSYDEAPREVVRPLISLLALEKVDFGHGRMTSAADTTTWELTAVTKSRLIRVTATAGEADWNFYSGEVPAVDVVAAAYRLTDITEVRVVGVTALPDGRRFSTTEPKWTTQYAVTIGGVECSLPTEESSYRALDERAAALSSAVLAATYR